MAFRDVIRVLFEVENDFDVLCARNAAKDLAREMGFSLEDRTRSFRLLPIPAPVPWLKLGSG